MTKIRGSSVGSFCSFFIKFVYLLSSEAAAYQRGPVMGKLFEVGDSVPSRKSGQGLQSHGGQCHSYLCVGPKPEVQRKTLPSLPSPCPLSLPFFIHLSFISYTDTTSFIYAHIPHSSNSFFLSYMPFILPSILHLLFLHMQTYTLFIPGLVHPANDPCLSITLFPLHLCVTSPPGER